MPNQHHQDQENNALLQSVNYQQEESSAQQQQGNKKKNNTGIPDRLKAVVEHFSGFSLDEVRVHYNSEKPAAVGALAYAEGLDIYIGPGQEQHLAHELWHVVQQMKGEVKETEKVNGKGINEEDRLEQQAEQASKKVEKPLEYSSNKLPLIQATPKGTIQRVRENGNSTKKDTPKLTYPSSVVNLYPSTLQQDIDHQIDTRTLQQPSLVEDLLQTPVVSTWGTQDTTLSDYSTTPSLPSLNKSMLEQLSSKQKALDFLKTHSSTLDSSFSLLLKSILKEDDTRTLATQAEHLLDALLENFDSGEWDDVAKVLEEYVDAPHQGKTGSGSKKKETAREEATKFLSSLKGIRIGFEEGLAFGNIVSGLTLIQSLQELGFKGGVTLVCPDSILKKFKMLKPDVEEVMMHEKQDAFEVGKKYDSPEQVEKGVLSLLANGDLVDHKSNEQILNYMKADVCLIMNPYGWKAGNGRRLLQRPTQKSEEEEVKVTKMDEKIDQEALYSFSIEEPENLEQYLQDNLKNVMPEKANGVIGLTKAVQKSKVLLQPVYGLHGLEDKNLANTEAYLSEGVKKAAVQDGKPVVLLMLSKARVDFLPEHAQDWLLRKNITEDDVADSIHGMKKGEVMVLDCGGLPNTVFTQMFKMASLPPLLEGANTSNLVQLLGLPWMSPKANTTEFPFHKEEQYKDAIQLLHNTCDALTGTSNFNEMMEEDDTYQELSAYQDLDYKVKQLQNMIKAGLWGEAQYDCFPLYSCITNIDDTYNKNDSDKKIGEETKSLTAKLKKMTHPQIMKGKQFELLEKEELEPLKTLATTKISTLKTTLKQALSSTPYQLDDKKIDTIATMIQQSYTEDSKLYTYFEQVKKTAKEEDRDQVIQGIKMLLEQVPNF